MLLRLTETHPAVTAKQIDDACNERERQYLEARAAAASRASSRAPLAVWAARATLGSEQDTAGGAVSDPNSEEDDQLTKTPRSTDKNAPALQFLRATMRSAIATVARRQSSTGPLAWDTWASDGHGWLMWQDGGGGGESFLRVH
eukprot:SAG25_NODE_170_length_13039_cov_23.733153_9_plen_144_part_00